MLVLQEQKPAFRGFRDRFLTLHTQFESLEDLNRKTHQWVEQDYNNAYHSGIQMKPIDRFNLDRARIKFLCDDAFSEEVFFIEESPKVSKTNVFSIQSQRFECPVDLREKTIDVRYDRQRKDHFSAIAPCIALPRASLHSLSSSSINCGKYS